MSRTLACLVRCFFVLLLSYMLLGLVVGMFYLILLRKSGNMPQHEIYIFVAKQSITWPSLLMTDTKTR